MMVMFASSTFLKLRMKMDSVAPNIPLSFVQGEKEGQSEHHCSNNQFDNPQKIVNVDINHTPTHI